MREINVVAAALEMARTVAPEHVKVATEPLNGVFDLPFEANF